MGSHAVETLPESGCIRLPVAPPEQLWPEDEECKAQPAVSDVSRLEIRLEEWMSHFDRRIDQLALLYVPPRALSLPRYSTSSEVRLSSNFDIDKEYKAGTQRQASALSSVSGLGPNSPHIAPVSEEYKAGTHRQGSALSSVSGLSPNLPHIASHSEEYGSTSDLAPPKPKKRDSAGKLEGLLAKRFGAMMHSKSLEKSMRQDSRRLGRIVSSAWFDLCISIVVVANVLIVGAQVDVEVRLGAEAVSRAFDYVEYACTAIFTLELGIRVFALGLGTLIAPNFRSLFVLDCVLVFVAWVDLFLTIAYENGSMSSSASVGKMLKVIRLGRVARLLRTMRLFAELRVMLTMIFSSVRSIVWLGLILLVVTYTFALVVTQGASDLLNGDVNLTPEKEDAIRLQFGSLMATMYTLIEAVTGGRDWGDIADTILEFGVFFFILAMLYIFLNLFSILNIVTGLFVDSAIEHAKRDRSLMVEKEIKKREASAHNLMSLLLDIDHTHTGTISEEDFKASLLRKEVKTHMDAFSIEMEDAKRVFAVLDRNMDGRVNVAEFVEGMQRMQGEAKSSDVQILRLQMQHVEDLLIQTREMLVKQKVLIDPQRL